MEAPMKLRKLFVTALIILSAITFGCAGGSQVMDRQPVNHELDIMVHSATDAVVTVGEKVLPSENPYLQLSQVTRINRAEDTAFMAIYSGLSVTDVKRLWEDLMYLNEETSIRKVVLFINSGGGGAFAGLALADLIMRAQSDYGISFEANASGIIASAAVPPFAVADYRIAAKGTIFMVHEAALWKWPGRETSSDIRAQNELMILLQDRYLTYLVAHSKLSLEKWQQMEKATTWFSAEKALTEIGIVDEIK